MASAFLNELKRKSIHIAVLLVVIIYSLLDKSSSKEVSLFVLVFILLILLVIEFLRLELNMDIPIVNQVINSKEERRMHGAIYFLSAAIISLAVFDFRIALAAMLMAVFGDLAASIVGQKFGRALIFRNKTIGGCSAELIMNLIVGLIALNNIYLIIAMAFTATIVEILVNELDDNLMVPLFSGFVGQLMFLLI